MTKEKIEEKIEQEIQKIAGLSRMLKGTINKVNVKSAGANGRPKVVYQLTYKGVGNVTKTIYLRKERLVDAKKMTRNHQKAKECLDRIVKLNEELFKIESKKDVSH